MRERSEFRLQPFEDLQDIKGIAFPASLKFRQLLVTGPPGCGKTRLINKIGGWPEEGFQMENALSREDALRAMTIWAARAGFEEHLKGSIEVGKLADFTITTEDLMTAPEESLYKIEVKATYSGGELVYGAGK